MSHSFITKFQNNKKKLSGLVSSLVLVILVVFALLFLIAQDLYLESLSHIQPYTILQPEPSFHPETNQYAILFYSEVFISTNSTYPQVESWYVQKGWDCWGLCESGGQYNVGKLTFSTFKVMGEFKMAPSENTKNRLLIIRVSESYGISYTGNQ